MRSKFRTKLRSKRNVLLIVLIMVSASLDGLFVYSSFPAVFYDKDWILNIHNSTTQINNNATKLTFSYNLTLPHSFTFKTFSSGGKFLVIKSNTTEIASLISSGMSTSNYKLDRGSHEFLFTVYFVLPGTNISSFTGINSFVLTVPTNGSFFFMVRPNSQFPSFQGIINFKTGSTLIVSLSPSYFLISGFFFSSRITFDLFLFYFTTLVLSELSIVTAIYVFSEYKNFKAKITNSQNSNIYFFNYILNKFRICTNNKNNKELLSEKTFHLLDEIIDENS